MNDAAHDRMLQTGMQVHQAGDQGRQPEIFRFFASVACFEHLSLADVLDLSVTHQYGALFDGRLGNGQNVFSAQ